MRKRNSVTAYGVAVLALVLLIAAAFWGPEIVFAVQDDINCQYVVSVSPEKLDIASFNTGYETDLYRRLTRFAEGLAGGVQYYVTIQDMEIPSQGMTLRDFDKIVQDDGMEMLVWNLLSPNSVFGTVWSVEMLGNRVYDAEVACWKQCVIYGDDFAEGVNFILWYLELRGEGIPKSFKLLADGETGEIYGVRVVSGQTRGITQEDLIAEWQEYSEASLAERYQRMLENFQVYDNNWEVSADVWDVSVVLGARYGGIDFVGRFQWLEDNGYYTIYAETVDGVGKIRVMQSNSAADTEGEGTGAPEGEDYQLSEIMDFLNVLGCQADEENKRLNFTYPFGEGTLNLRIQLGNEIVSNDEEFTIYMNEIFGFPEIYELIPDFMESTEN